MTLLVLAAFDGGVTVSACVLGVLLKRELCREVGRILNRCAEDVR